ncbi:MAG: peroxiredoxin family protein [Chloroflexi bacterium]|nr:peroxiredoxin family protein [Chloroflexota bacterium]
MTRVLKTFRNLVVLLGVSLLSVPFLSGCASSGGQVRTGMSLADSGYDLKPGDEAPEFVFRADNQQLCPFSTIRGHVTLVLFPTNPDWPDCAMCRQVADLAQSESVMGVNVVAISVAQPARSAAQALPAFQACQVQSDHLIAICDQHAQIRRLYGPRADGRFFVVDNDGHISEVGAIADLKGLRTHARAAVLAANEKESWQGD